MSAKQYGRLEAPKPAEEMTVFAPRRSESRPLLALGLIIAAVCTFVALADYSPKQPFLFEQSLLSRFQLDSARTDANTLGTLGATFAVLALNCAGWAAFFLPPGLALFAGYALFYRAHTLFPWKTVFLTLAFLSLCVLLREAHTFTEWSPDRLSPAGVGGALGLFLYDQVFNDLLGRTGTGIVFGLIYLVSFSGLFVDDPRVLIARQMDALRSWMENMKEERRIRREAMLEVRRKQAAALAEARKKIAEAKAKGGAVVLEKTDKPAKSSKKAAAAAALATAEGAEGAEESPASEPSASADEPPSGGEEFGEAAGRDGTVPLSAPAAVSPAAVATPAAARTAGFGVMQAPRPLEPGPMTSADSELAFSPAVSSPGAVDAKPVADTPSTPPVPRAALPATPLAVPQTAAGKLTIVEAEPVEKVAGTLTPKLRGDYRFPPVTLLSEAPASASAGPAENYEERAEALVRTLGEFKIKVAMGEVQSGPVITRYEVLPAPGVRVEKISGLANNLAMNLKAESVRVLAPVPGKGTVGIEVPNRRPKPVCLREIIESKVWDDNKCDIPVVLGKDVTGKPIVADLAKMPHALIAGSTGAGKSVCINGIIASLLYHASPDDLRFIMVDPKVVEMQVYNRLPHMLIPVVTECKKVPGALKWLIAEMERRYRIFAKTGVKNIAGFNARIAKDKDAAAKAGQLDLSLSPEERQAAREAVSVGRDDGVLEIPDRKLPYIVCIIDELADLMMVAPADIETGIARLAQLARAAGIHLILATQRPSVNVITGVIKANLPCRIAFKVTSVIDSRTILDGKGAESLIGKGDMLFIPPGAASLVRAQGAFVSEEEVHNLVDYINRENGDPEFADDVQEAIELAAMEDSDDDGAPTEGTGDESDDPMIQKSWDIIRSTKRASTSMLQRRLSIGYNRAARIMDILEERGYVGPENGSSPREILREV